MSSSTNSTQPSVAIIGGGIAGMAAAWPLLEAGCNTHIFESQAMLGGDAYTLNISNNNCEYEYCVDGGVSDFNLATFNTFKAFLSDFKLQTEPVNQSLSCMNLDRKALYYISATEKQTWDRSTSWDHVFLEWKHFAETSKEVLEVPEYRNMTVENYLSLNKYSEDFIQYIFKPRAYACFLSPSNNILSFPIRTLVSFWSMHGIVGDAPATRVRLVGGKQTYINAFTERYLQCGGKLSLSSHVNKIDREKGKISVECRSNYKTQRFNFDHVVLASKPDTVLSMLKHPTTIERTVFSQYPAQQADMVIHTDKRLMPEMSEAHAAYNILETGDKQLSKRPNITFWTNRLSNTESGHPDVYASLNPFIKPAPDKVIYARKMTHPVSNFDAWRKNNLLNTVQGQNNTWYCGSYLQLPHLHENACATGLNISEQIKSQLEQTEILSA